MDLIVHHKISDLYKSLNLPLEQEVDFTIHYLPDLHTQLPFQSPQFRAEYFSFVFIKEGKGYYTIDTHRFAFDSNTIYFTNPGHIKSFEIIESKEAYIITLNESFLRENVHPNIFDEFPFLLAEIVPPKKMSEQEYASFEMLYKQVEQEFGKNSEYKNRILGNLFVVILLKIKEAFWASYNARVEGSRDSEIVRSFKALLEEEFRLMTSGKGREHRIQVKDFADQLYLHPNYLNSVIKSKTGKTVNAWIVQKTLARAKSLLKNTSSSAKEIAYILGFSEPTHFNRFFKKHLKITPTQFRKKN